MIDYDYRMKIESAAFWQRVKDWIRGLWQSSFGNRKESNDR